MTAEKARDLALLCRTEELLITLEGIKKAASKGYMDCFFSTLSANALKKLVEMGYSTSCQGRNGLGDIVYKISWEERV